MASLGLSNSFQGVGSPHTNSRTERALIQIRTAKQVRECFVLRILIIFQRFPFFLLDWETE